MAPVGHTWLQAPQPMHSSAGRVKSKYATPAGVGVGHAQRVDAHLAAGGHAQTAADADVAAQAAARLVVRHRVGQALLDLDVVALAEDFFDGPFGHHGAR